MLVWQAQPSRYYFTLSAEEVVQGVLKTTSIELEISQTGKETFLASTCSCMCVCVSIGLAGYEAVAHDSCISLFSTRRAHTRAVF